MRKSKRGCARRESKINLMVRPFLSSSAPINWNNGAESPMGATAAD
jgi:hypothetical protein